MSWWFTTIDTQFLWATPTSQSEREKAESQRLERQRYLKQTPAPIYGQRILDFGQMSGYGQSRSGAIPQL
jgi:hypothetical protein